MPRPETTSLPTVTSCENCCSCCMHMDYPAYITGSDTQPPEEHWVNLPHDLKEELLQYIADYDEPAKGELGTPCFWLDLEKKCCKHHEYRPNVCRDFDVGCTDCLGWRKEYYEQPSASP